MPMTLGYIADMASDNVVSVCLGLERISRAAQAKSEVVQGVVGASPRSCAQRPRTQVRNPLIFITLGLASIRVDFLPNPVLRQEGRVSWKSRSAGSAGG